MPIETVKAKTQLKDAKGNVQVDEEGKAIYKEVAVDYDFGDNLQSAIALCGSEDVVFSNYVSAARINLQAILRAKLTQGMDADAIQTFVSGWKPGMQLERQVVNPEQAVVNAFNDWPEEKKLEFLQKLGIGVGVEDVG